MHFSITASSKGGLKVIPEIDDFRLSWIEGRNGIGKTIAVRLLELATGSQPYESNPAAWESLKRNLEAVEIRVAGLRDGGYIEITLEPSIWPDKPSQGALLGTAKLNGKEISFEE